MTGISFEIFSFYRDAGKIGNKMVSGKTPPRHPSKTLLVAKAPENIKPKNTATRSLSSSYWELIYVIRLNNTYVAAYAISSAYVGSVRYRQTFYINHRWLIYQVTPHTWHKTRPIFYSRWNIHLEKLTVFAQLRIIRAPRNTYEKSSPMNYAKLNHPVLVINGGVRSLHFAHKVFIKQWRRRNVTAKNIKY